MSMQFTFLRRILGGAAAVLLLFFSVGGASLAKSGTGQPEGKPVVVRETHVFGFPAEDRCIGKSRVITITYTARFLVHESVSAAGHARYWTSMEQNGTFDLGETTSHPTYRGTFELVEGGPDVAHSGSSVLVVHLQGLGADGSPFKARLFEHIDMTPHGPRISLTTPVLDMAQATCA